MLRLHRLELFGLTPRLADKLDTYGAVEQDRPNLAVVTARTPNQTWTEFYALSDDEFGAVLDTFGLTQAEIDEANPEVEPIPPGRTKGQPSSLQHGLSTAGAWTRDKGAPALKRGATGLGKGVLFVLSGKKQDDTGKRYKTVTTPSGKTVKRRGGLLGLGQLIGRGIGGVGKGIGKGIGSLFRRKPKTNGGQIEADRAANDFDLEETMAPQRSWEGRDVGSVDDISFETVPPEEISSEELDQVIRFRPYGDHAASVYGAAGAALLDHRYRLK